MNEETLNCYYCLSDVSRTGYVSRPFLYLSDCSFLLCLFDQHLFTIYFFLTDIRSSLTLLSVTVALII